MATVEVQSSRQIAIPMADERELPPFISTGTSFLRTSFNALNALSGIGIVTLPYTLSQGGWLSIALLLVMATVTCFTGLLLQRCMDSNPLIKTYPDIGYYAFGRKGRMIISILTYLELYLVPTGFLILEGDNLYKLFPKVSFALNGYKIGGKQLFIILAGLIVSPTMWLKDLSGLSFVSACGFFATVIILCSIFWVGAIDGVGFSGKGELFDLSGTPTILSLYAFCYGAHPVFPTLYSSMNDKGRFSKVLYICFGITSLTYALMAILGYSMFGKNVESQVTLNLPTDKLSSKIAIYTILAIPMSKYALIMTPIAEAIDIRLPNLYQSKPIFILVRTLIVMSSVVIAISFPYFVHLTSLIGAILDVIASIVLPCLCYLKLLKVYEHWSFEFTIIIGIIVMAVSVAVTGTFSSIKDMFRHS